MFCKLGPKKATAASRLEFLNSKCAAIEDASSSENEAGSCPAYYHTTSNDGVLHDEGHTDDTAPPCKAARTSNEVRASRPMDAESLEFLSWELEGSEIDPARYNNATTTVPPCNTTRISGTSSVSRCPSGATGATTTEPPRKSARVDNPADEYSHLEEVFDFGVGDSPVLEPTTTGTALHQVTPEQRAATKAKREQAMRRKALKLSEKPFEELTTGECYWLQSHKQAMEAEGAKD